VSRQKLNACCLSFAFEMLPYVQLKLRVVAVLFRHKRQDTYLFLTSAKFGGDEQKSSRSSESSRVDPATIINRSTQRKEDQRQQAIKEETEEHIKVFLLLSYLPSFLTAAINWYLSERLPLNYQPFTLCVTIVFGASYLIDKETNRIVFTSERKKKKRKLIDNK
jgi:hypothetical protein